MAFFSVVSWVRVLFGIFLCWATLDPSLALPVSVIAIALYNAIAGWAVTTSNALLHSRILTFQDSVTTMVHANILWGEVKLSETSQRENFGRTIDEAIDFVDLQSRNARLNPVPIHRIDDSFWKNTKEVIFGFIVQTCLFFLASALGLYFSEIVKDGLDTLVNWVISFR